LLEIINNEPTKPNNNNNKKGDGIHYRPTLSWTRNKRARIKTVMTVTENRNSAKKSSGAYEKEDSKGANVQ
jgi:hypothetical protein